MSRIILSEYDTGEARVVVGWDRPLATYFWQEFNKEPEPDQSGEVNWPEDWEEMLRFAGYEMRELPNMRSFLINLPDDIRPLVNDRVQRLLKEHYLNPNAGRIVVNLVREANAS